MSTTITLSTKPGYPTTYVASEVLNIEGIDAFISCDHSGRTYADGSKASSGPEVTFIGITISGQPIEDKKTPIRIGDRVAIGDKEYQLLSSKAKYFGNGDVFLSPVN